MDDTDIIELYWRRDESAVAETDAKYGAYCRAVSMNILGIFEDAEECVNDTYVRAWNAMPPARPKRLRVWLARITRNLSLDRWSRDRAAKRGGGMTVLLSELDECIPSAHGLEETADAKELARNIDRWLAALPEAERTVFLRRYWIGESVSRIAQSLGMNANTLTKRLGRMDTCGICCQYPDSVLTMEPCWVMNSSASFHRAYA